MSQNVLPSARKPSKWKWVLIIIVLLAACGAGGYYWWRHPEISGWMKRTTTPPPPPAPIFLALDTFTVNLVNPTNDPERVLYIGVTLRLPDEATRKRLNEYLPAVRSRLIMLLSRQDADALASVQGKQQLIQQIKQVLSVPYVNGQAGPVVDDVLFTAFILR
ncbi:flagellar basal body-associated protein FliL [Martelella alba]|uniref:Flagellar protein FliL n=1 Tax=Martelella alba TaxID=2590451 RepID=A0ABY2SQF7_9HYPH|nr:flagellar basal body-associated protein FliL [Martelella alba]TKI08284.1 flagellar basal body-associated protein FliL [Martelella alba]